MTPVLTELTEGSGGPCSSPSASLGVGRSWWGAVRATTLTVTVTPTPIPLVCNRRLASRTAVAWWA
ncbi:MAG: hypothetical protein ACRDJU_06670 [Actinomycetota bacterium]